MKVAYLIDRDSIGGGMEYIRRKIEANGGNDECRVFFADRGECTASRLNEWGAAEISVNHLKALVQLFRNPLVRPLASVTFTVHGIHLRKYDFLPRTPANVARRFLRLTLERILYAQCDRIVALTQTDAHDIRRLYGKSLNVVVEPNEVCATEFSEPSAPLKYERDEFAFVCIARFNFQKGQDILIKAIASVQDALRSRRSRTLLIGDGEMFGEVRRLADELGVSDLVEFAGAIPNAGVYMTCGRTLVAPSRWEGMPYLLLEAVARRRRVIASDCPGNPDALSGYGNAALFPNNAPHALAALLSRE